MRSFEPNTGVALPLHCALMRNLGVTLTEIAWLDDLADACAADGRWSFFYVAAPLKGRAISRARCRTPRGPTPRAMTGSHRRWHGTGAPVNPVAIR